MRQAVWRFNALKSGILARAYRIAGEDAASLAPLVRNDDPLGVDLMAAVLALSPGLALISPC